MGQIFEYLKIALMNIRSNKGRSLLTMLGIIIGISSVIMIISIGSGVEGQINGELNSMAGGQVSVYSQDSDLGGGVRFTDDDIERLIENIDGVKGASPTYGLRGTLLSSKGSFDTMLTLGNQYLQYNSNNAIVHGKYFTETDYLVGNKVCVVSESDAVEMFGSTDVVGMTIDVTLYNVTQEFRICGVRKDAESSMLDALMYDAGISLECPLTATASFGFFFEQYSDFYIYSENINDTTAIAQKAVKLLEAFHNVRGKENIYVESFSDYMTQINSVLGYVTLFISLVAAISLLVGGIGVMNIMLVSVTERTREIGIRKSLGARTGSILFQFLSESAVITLLGGIIGITLGYLGAVLVCKIAGLEASISIGTVLGTTFFSSAVGIFFGIYPARKAAKLNPIEALRHE